MLKGILTSSAMPLIGFMNKLIKNNFKIVHAMRKYVQPGREVTTSVRNYFECGRTTTTDHFESIHLHIIIERFNDS